MTKSVKEKEVKKENIKAEAVTRPEKKIRGKVEQLERAEWNYMRKPLMLTDDKIFPLREATCPAKINDKSATLIRIFNPDAAKEKGITIEDYESLSEHPELILYEGYHIKGRGGEIVIEKRNEIGASLIEEKIKEGVITEVGVIKEKTATQKWLGRFGKFFMYGGWLLIAIVGVGLAIAISIWTKGC
jgi:hypothetical protein